MLDLSEDEVKFYAALIENESAVPELSDEILKTIAQELTDNLCKNVTVDWAERESVRAQIAPDGQASAEEIQVPTGFSRQCRRDGVGAGEGVGESWV